MNTTSSSVRSIGLHARSTGFGLVEVLVAMAIGMIGILAIMQAFAVNERYKENTVGTSSSQANGNIAIFSIERDLRMAGFGLASTAALSCGNVRYYFDGAYSDPPGGGVGAPLPALTLAPVVITQGVAGAPDTITMLSSSNGYRTVPTVIDEDASAATVNLVVSNRTGLTEGELLLLVQAPPLRCALAQITALPAAAPKQVQRLASSYNPDGAASALPDFSKGSQLYGLGTPIMRRYSISTNNLAVADWTMVLNGTAPTVIVDEIVDLQAEYGFADGTFSTVTPTTEAQWITLRSIRLAVLARGSYERPGTDGVCTVTTAVPTWTGSAQSPLQIPGGVPSCYRYRVFETVVPLRNLIWREDRV
jgi:type IV pilus assembly protein PilW